jgi:hypothetical protein
VSTTADGNEKKRLAIFPKKLWSDSFGKLILLPDGSSSLVTTAASFVNPLYDELCLRI